MDYKIPKSGISFESEDNCTVSIICLFKCTILIHIYSEKNNIKCKNSWEVKHSDTKLPKKLFFSTKDLSENLT